ncbi:MAG TPA: hypothetical protein DCF63_20725 [Planctomycetaceae bacterium]|nr:hypothetical protein [Planctomycetaceae bacterium]
MTNCLWLLKNRLLGVGLSLTLFGSATNAAPISLVVDSTQSTLSLTGVAFGLNYNEQSPGSNTTSLGGTLSADLTAGVFTFSGGSAVSTNVNPLGPFSHNPFVFEGGTSSTGSFGTQGSGAVFGFGFVTIKGNYRNIVIDITSGTAQNGAPASGSNVLFSAAQLVWGAINDADPPLTAGGNDNLAGKTGLNTSANNVSWDGTTLSMPVSFQTSGSNRVEIWQGIIVAKVVAPAPVLVNSRPYHNAFPGADGPAKVDTSVSLIQRGVALQTVQLGNIISSTQGINGVVLDFDNLAALNNITLEYKWSPQNVFTQAIADWAAVSAPATTALLPDAGQGGSDRVRITWPNGSIVDRYLCIKVIYDGVTIAELYLGHLRGEMTGASAGKFTVLVGDILAVRTDLSLPKTAIGRTDVDKSGTVLVQDILDTRSNLSKELTQVDVPALP